MEDNIPKIGQKIYVDTHCYISHGSDDVDGGVATVSAVEKGISGGEKCIFVCVKEHPGHKYNWSQVLAKEQESLKAEFGTRRAKTSPDIDRPWIEDGDFVDGKIYHGPDIW